MKKLKVWRIENQDGFGPYRGANSEEARKLLAYVEGPRVYAIAGVKSFNERRFKRMCKNGWKFAWLAKEDAVNHCKGNLDKLNNLGFILHWMVVERYRIFPDGQVMYFK